MSGTRAPDISWARAAEALSHLEEWAVRPPPPQANFKLSLVESRSHNRLDQLSHRRVGRERDPIDVGIDQAIHRIDKAHLDSASEKCLLHGRRMEKSRISSPSGQRRGDGIATPIRDRSGHQHFRAGHGSNAGAAIDPVVAELDMGSNRFAHEPIPISLPPSPTAIVGMPRRIASSNT